MHRECRGRFPRHRLQKKPLASDPGMHHGTCFTHVPWCMPRSLTRGGGENVPGIPNVCATDNFAYLARCSVQYFNHIPKHITVTFTEISFHSLHSQTPNIRTYWGLFLSPYEGQIFTIKAFFVSAPGPGVVQMMIPISPSDNNPPQSYEGNPHL